MKRKSLTALLLVLVMVMSVMVSACNKAPKTIEEYINNDKESLEQINSAADESGLTVEFSGNDVTYSYDLTNTNGASEELLKSDVMISQLTSQLESTQDQFVGLCKQLEEESKIEGIHIIINYKYGDEVLVTRTFDSSGIVE